MNMTGPRRTWRNKLATALIGGFLCAGLPATAAAQDSRPASRTIERTIAAADLKTLDVKANVGKIRLTAGSGDKVVVTLVLTAQRRDRSWLGLSRWGDPAAVELDVSKGGSRLGLDLRGEREGLKEEWTIEAPERLAARLRVNVGELEARDLSGGIDARVNVGDLSVEVPRGGIDAETNVGNLRVVTSTRSYGNVHVEANIGGVDLRLGGRRVESRRRRYGPGDSISISGRGDDNIRLRSNIGDARLEIRDPAA